MDTLVTVKSTDVSDELVWQCEGRIYEIESAISKTAEESDVYKFNRSDEGVALSDDSSELISRVLSLCPLVNGAYDPTLASVCELWDITGDAKIPEEKELSDALLHTGYQKLSLDGSILSKNDPELKLDLGGAGKGYACEKAVEVLSASDGYGLVSFGSSIGVFGSKPDAEPWNIAITDPYDQSSTVGYVSIESGYVTVSGDYERYAEIDGVRYAHIIDPNTGRPLSNGVHSVVIVSADAVVGDVLSTALMVGGEEAITEFKNAGIEFEALIISDRGYTMTDKMKEILTLYEEKK
ncbi:MAG: FAD:protein FMN transferase [Clostridia bacterium]|nr:FAD:protein FMN transferase [Clostridia bacterium]